MDSTSSDLNCESREQSLSNENNSLSNITKDKVVNKKNVLKKVMTRLNRLSLQKKFDKFLEVIIEMLLEKNIICPDSKVTSKYIIIVM